MKSEEGKLISKRYATSEQGKRTARQKVLKKYQITLEQYEQMKIAQDSRCKICGEIDDKELCVDHDHETGKVRALLCTRCNIAIGLLGENTSTLKRAIVYLQRYREDA